MDPWNRNPLQRIEDAKEHKRLGTENFKDQDFKAAGEFYIRALRDVIPIIPVNEEHIEDVMNIKQTCYANLAACQLKLRQFKRVIINCNKVLEIDSSNVKTLYRRASAHLECRDADKAKNDVEKILSMEPENTAAKELERKLAVMFEKKKKADAKIMQAYMSSS